MSVWRIVLANLKYSRRQHFGTSLGAALATMILVAALTIGDSVSSALSKKARERVGSITHIALSEEGYFHADLASRIQVSSESGVVAPILMTEGTVASPDGRIKASGIKVLGIDDRFFSYADSNQQIPKIEGGFWFSPDLAHELGVKSDVRMIIRVEEPSLFSRDAPLSGERDARFVSWNDFYRGVLKSSYLGNFSIRANMDPVRTVFVPLTVLQEKMFINFDPENDRTDYANILLTSSKLPVSDLEQKIRDAWTLSDAGLYIKKLSAVESWSLRTRSVFLPDSIVEVAKKVNQNLEGELTYLVNAIKGLSDSKRSNDLLIPYSMATGIELGKRGILPAVWQDHKIALNQWAADDLNVSIGDWVSLEYYVTGKHRKLVEQSNSFQVGKVLTMPTKVLPGEESDWTPNFPGLSGAENCGDWNIGIPIKYDIRAKDEAYWDNFRGSPKAFVSLKAAQDMWSNRWGGYTGLRVKGKERMETFKNNLEKELRPASSGIRVIDLKRSAMVAQSGPIDFSHLFLAFGAFVMVAGFSLSGMIFGFSLEQRNQQVGIFRAMGYPLSRVRYIFYLEALVVSLFGTLMGIGWAYFFGHGILWMLGGAWSGAVSDFSITYQPTIQSVSIGVFGSFLMSFVSLWWVARKQRSLSLNALLSRVEYLNQSSPKLSVQNRKSKFLEFGCWGLGFLTVGITWLYALPVGPSFFGAGAFMLAGGLLRFYRTEKEFIQVNKANDLLSQFERKPGRKLIVVGILAIGSFLVLGAGAFYKKEETNPFNFKSGTGGFSHILTTGLSIYDDLKSSKGMELFDLDSKIMAEITLLPCLVFEGDEASCLNLNQSVSPPLYGVEIDKMKNRFTFVAGDWSSLTSPMSKDVYPALVDQNTLLWSLKKKVGDRITYINGEGKAFEVEIVSVVKGSFLQGGIYISDEHWLANFPARGGYNRMFMTVKKELEESIIPHLNNRLLNYGLMIQTTEERLNKLKAVENTYLSIFQAMGGLGVILGTLGLLISVLRNLWERRREYALLKSLGYTAQKLRLISLKENIAQSSQGLAIGLISGLFALLPTIWSDAGSFFPSNVFLFGICLFFLSTLFVYFGVFLGLRYQNIHLLSHE